MAEAERSASPNTKELRVRLRRLKLDQFEESENGCVFVSKDDDADDDEGDADGDNVSGKVPQKCEGPDESTVATQTPPTSPSTVSDISLMGLREENLKNILESEIDLSEADELVKDLPEVLMLPPFDPYAPVPPTNIAFKPVISLVQLSLREDNVIEVEVSKKLLSEYSKSSKQSGTGDHSGGNGSNSGGCSSSDDEATATGDEDFRSFTDMDAEISMKLLCEYSKNVMRNADGQLRPITDLADIFVKHDKNEFYTFCSCKLCLEYRETIMSIMMDQFKAAHMVVMLLDVLIKAYSPLLKNDLAYNKFEKLLESNKETYWITSGYLYDKNADYLDFIDDTTISDNMILVLFSSILMVNNPMLLLQILSYNVESIVKGFSDGIIGLVDPREDKMPAEKMLTYILDGYADLNCISQKIALSLFAFENDFLRKFKLTWVLLCQRLFQKHVFSHLSDTLLTCIITLKEETMTPHHSSLIKRYILFDEHMNTIERRWSEIWLELNKFNTSEPECTRREGLLDVHSIFDIVVMDATSFSLPDISDDEFTDFQRIEDRHLAWRNIMAFTKLKWPDGFYEPPNMMVYNDKCEKCEVPLPYHERRCSCVTCSIAGAPRTPLAPVTKSLCSKCSTQANVVKNPKIKKSKLPLEDAATRAARKKSAAFDDFTDEMSTVAKQRNNDNETMRTTYHIAWAVFHHLTTRKRYRYDIIDSANFCSETCRVSACLVARKILNNEIRPIWTHLLVQYFQPLSLSREELRASLPSLMFFNRKMHPCNVELREYPAHNYILKTYWTFILSIYANFFMKFTFPSISDLSTLVIGDKDLGVRFSSIIGNIHDGGFEKFIYYTKKLSPFTSTDDLALLDIHIERTQRGLDKLMSMHEAQIIKSPRMEDPFRSRKMKEDQTPSSSSVASGPNSTKKPNKEKMKKCCLDYSDIGEHCKENHTKKRVKKECNHTRFNETRDRLRKKFANLLNERKKKIPQTVDQNKVTSTTGEANTPISTKKQTSHRQQVAAAAATQPGSGNAKANPPTKNPPSLKSVATAAAGFKATNERFKVASENSLSCLDSLCKRIQLGKPINCSKELRDAAVAKASSAKMEAVRTQFCEKMVASLHLSNSLGVVNEFYEFLDSYTKEQEKKWIDETLHYIEGPEKSHHQPQTTNPKKAAKKAKQKMRKEVEKRISELLDLRAQFQNIYFKEFTAKQELKTHVASSKNRDKKRISELETNIKKLQRAKAKVETGILELIATVKQINTEFKFTYLPTKEQQVQKLRNISEATQPTNQSSSSSSNTTVDNHETSTNSGSDANTNDDSMTSEMSNNLLPGGDLQQVIDFSINPNPNSNVFSPPLRTPMCYAPPHQQQLPVDVVNAMAANAVTADPTKRIVTIRRVNMPNAIEPQVTVTAKGRSPKEDKLLYTFVNGQLVPSSLSDQPTLLNDLDIEVCKRLRLPSIKNPQQQQTQLQPPQQQQQIKDTSLKHRTSTSTSSQNVLEEKLTKLNLNSGTGTEAKLLSDAKQAKQVKKQKQKALKALGKQQAQQSLSTKSSNSSTTTCSNSSSKSQTPLSSSMHTRENSVCSLKPPTTTSTTNLVKNHSKNQVKLKATKQQQQQQSAKSQKSSKNVTKTPAPETKPVAKSTEKSVERNPLPPPPPPIELKVATSKRQKRSKLIDNGQFDNNPFSTLQDSSESEWDSDSDSAQPRQESNIPEAAVAPPPASTLPITFGVVKTSTKALEKTVIEKKQPTTIKKKEVNDKESHAHATAPSTSTTNSKKNLKPEGSKHNQQPQAQPQQQQQQQQHQQKSQSSNKPQATNPKQQQQQCLRQPLSTQSYTSTNNSRQQQQQLESNVTRSRGSGKQQHLQTLPSPSASNKHQQQVQTHQQQQHQQQNQQQRTQRNSSRVASSTSSNSHQVPYTPSNIDSNSKRNQRNNKRYQKQKQDCMSGIPNNMGYFNPNELDIPLPPAATQTHISPPRQQQQQHHQLTSSPSTNYGNSASGLCQQLQNMRISNQASPQSQSYVGGGSKPSASNVSIMDQLNRGVQVEDLSLPPGITLTKVDPVKSELLRQKSETIQKVIKPMPTQRSPQSMANVDGSMPGISYSQQSNAQRVGGSTNPSATMYNYYDGAYGDSSGIFMVETNPMSSVQQHQQKSSVIGQQQTKPNAAAVAAAAAAASSSGKSSSRRRRRNKTKSVGSPGDGNGHGNSKTRDNIADANVGVGGGPSKGGANFGPNKVVTLRNPMFHGNTSDSGCNAPSGVSASVIQQHQQQPSQMLPSRPYSGIPLTASLPMDQPAAIIKNDNGMFTIRNPVLHQAVTNGLAYSGYRQFGNVNFYTPQEAVAEASRATQLSQQQQQQQQQQHQTEQQQHPNQSSCGAAPAPSSFSYFSSGMANTVDNIQTNSSSTHNNISISCTNVKNSNVNDGYALTGSRLHGEAAVIARPTRPIQQKCISAIGSEIKQKTKETTHQWSNFGQDFSTTTTDFNNPTKLQKKYQQSNYYNDFEVFPAVQTANNAGGAVGGSTFFESPDCHIPHHSCGDDSPPPTITGFNSYLEGIPNTGVGVIRYDDASFLKNLIPGQQLNNEVSIHNISDTNFVKSASSPSTHHQMDMPSVYGGRRPSNTNPYDKQQLQSNANTGATFCDPVNDYPSNDSQFFSSSNLMMSSELDVRNRYNYDFEPPTVSTTSSSTSATVDSQPQGIMDLNDYLRRSPHSQSPSPYNIDDNAALETFVQNMNALQIVAASTGTTTDDSATICPHLNSSGTEANLARANTESTATVTSNGWW